MHGAPAAYLVEHSPSEQGDTPARSSISIHKLETHDQQLKLAFMSALESFPVHCLKSWPCGNCRRPENGGTIAIL